MTDLPLATEPPFDFISPERYESEVELRRNANERARYLARVHNLRDPVAWSVAIAEQGAAVPRRIGSSPSTVSGYPDDIEERFEFEHTVWKPPGDRIGPLDGGKR
jgi:hypothetical protein